MTQEFCFKLGLLLDAVHKITAEGKAGEEWVTIATADVARLRGLAHDVNRGFFEVRKKAEDGQLAAANAGGAHG